MPRTVLPPTPASSTDIKGQDGTKQLATLQMSFELPEPALMAHETNQQRTPTEETSSLKRLYPLQPSETVKSRRRSSAAQPAKDQFTLPPPPTRSRKIIQMKPRSQQETTPSSGAAARNNVTPKAGAVGGASPGPAATGGIKRKQPSSSSAAGRKMARKTAHSLIERRRRSKMNDEFATLKNMIPACSGEMHKLSILQASIEYVRYLEECVATLKAQRSTEAGLRQDGHDIPGGDEQIHHRHEHHDHERTEDTSPDVDMTGSEPPSPTYTSVHSRSQQSSISPALLAQDAQSRHNSHSSVSTDQRYYRDMASASTSPAFGPQGYHYATSIHSAAGSALTSPALAPQRDMDQEATTALLMLNQSDRRGTNGSSAGRGMSVRDLLST